MATVKALHIAIGARVEGFQRGMNKAKRELQSFEKSTRRARGMIVGATGAMARGFAAIGAAATVAIADSIRVFADFETSMLRIKALTGATGAEFQSLTNLAKDLGSTTAFTAREAADAMGFLARAGFEVNEIMKGIPSVLNLAAAGELELATAAEIASNTLRGFGLEASEMDRVANVLAAGAAKSNTSVEALGEAFKMVSSDAKGMGLSIEETTAFLGALANVGVKGTMGGTALRVVFAQMGDEILAHGGLLPALQALDKDGVAAVVKAMSDLGIRAGSSAVKLANQIPVIEELTQELGTLDDFAGDMAETMLSGLAGSAVKTGSALEGLRIQIGETFHEFGTGFFDELTNTFQAMNEELKGSEDNFENLETAGKMMAKGLVFSLEIVASAIAMVTDLLVQMSSNMADSIMKVDNMARGLKGGFGAEGILSAEDRQALELLLELGTGESALDRVSSYFAGVDARLDATSRATRTGPTRGEGMDDFYKAIEFGFAGKRLVSRPEDAPGFGTKPAIEEVAEEVEEIDLKELDRFIEGMAALPQDVMTMMERRGLGQFADELMASDITKGELGRLSTLLEQAETLRGEGSIFEEVRKAILESFIDLPEPEKKEPEDPVQGFAETISTVLGQVRVDPLAGKKDSDNLEKIQKNTGEFANMLRRLESFT